MAHVWILFDQTWVADEAQHYEGTKLVGVFTSREAALYWYAEEVVGPAQAARIDWDGHEAYALGYDPETRWPILELVREEVREFPPPTCWRCGTPVAAESTQVRLKLCTLHLPWGLEYFCVQCGENWPEHGPQGRGCATFLGERD